MQVIKNLLWIDCTAGALAGVLVVLFSEWLGDLYAISQSLLLFIGVVNLLYACCSCSLAIRARRQELLINVLVLANATWAFICVGMVAQSYGSMAPLGIAHIAGEAIFVGGLAALEWKWRDQLLAAV